MYVQMAPSETYQRTRLHLRKARLVAAREGQGGVARDGVPCTIVALRGRESVL